jgi:exodeoxyribonuclease V gamma subunit
MSTPLLLLNRAGGAWLGQSVDRRTGTINWDEACQRQACDKLVQAWQGDGFTPGEGQDPYLQRIMRQLDEPRIQEIIQAAQTYLLAPFCCNLAETEKPQRTKK